MLKDIYYFINNKTSSLYTIIINTDYFFIDYWSFVHLITGMLIISFLKRSGYRHPFYILLTLLIGWEIIEISFIYFSIKVFNPETIPDQITDIFIGFAGGLIIFYAPLLKKVNKLSELLPKKSIEPIIACSMSFLWVGLYGYRYNIEFFNSPFINWLAFILWSIGLFLTIKVYQLLGKLIACFWKKILATWFIYFMALLFIEFLGYHVFKIRQVTYETPLIFGLIHGTKILKYYYIFAGILAILLNNLLKNLRTAPLSKVIIRQESYQFKNYDNS